MLLSRSLCWFYREKESDRRGLNTVGFGVAITHPKMTDETRDRASSPEIISTSPYARGGLELGTGTGTYGACRSTQCCVAVWPRWVESSTRLGGFEGLKKTLEAPHTTKVNYR